ncbi:hypothetical protein DNTS_027465, partial [Danionella cerebrum]
QWLSASVKVPVLQGYIYRPLLPYKASRVTCTFLPSPILFLLCVCVCVCAYRSSSCSPFTHFTVFAWIWNLLDRVELCSDFESIRAATYTALDEGGLSPLPKRAKPTYLAMDKENQIIGYVVPIFRGSREFESGLSDTEDARLKESAGSLARRNLFTSSLESERNEYSNRRTLVRDSAERISLSKRIHEQEEYHKRLNEDSLMHTPEFLIKPRSHTVWETQYKNNVSIDPMSKPGKYKVDSSYNVHSLEINRCDFDDTAQYRVSAMNSKGENSAYASVVVKRFKGELDESAPAPRLLPCLEYGVTFETHIVDKFGVSFGREGETLSLGCSVIIYPSLQRFQPEIEWYRDDKLLVPSKWMQMHWSGDRATLTLTHLNKEDEGLYTLRVITKSSFETHSAYVFVRDSEADVAGAPGAPLDVHCLDANKDYVIVSWKQPAVDGGSAILGYFVDRCEVGTTHWAQCNDTPVKFARFPVTGLVEGRSYMFQGVVPGRPQDLSVIEATKNYVVLSWKPPGDKGHEGVMYYVEKCVSGTDSWQRVNTEIPVKSPRFALFDLAEGKSYRFRVRCCNSAGVGEPSEPTEATTVGDKLDIPSAPGRVVPTRNTDTSVVVSWEASRDAKELVGYYIETSIAGSNAWEPCNNKPVKGTRFVCHGLTTGESYVFRVRAVNAAGISEFSQESEAIEVKAAIGGGIPHGVCLDSGGSGVTLTQHSACEVAQCPAGTALTCQVNVCPMVEAGARDTEHEGHHATLDEGKQQAPEPAQGLEKESPNQVAESSTDRSMKMKNLAQKELAENRKCCVNSPTEQKKAGGQKRGRRGSASPAPPFGISVLECVRDSMVLAWKQPTFIGGADITGYFVDYREVIDGVPGKWHEANIRSIKLKENMLYQFQVRAANMAGVGIPSLPSETFKCEEWTIAVPGRDPVNGYYIDIKEAEADFEMWRGVNEKATDRAFMKIKELKEGETYVFRVRAQNKAGVGKASDPTEPVQAVTKPGTAEIVVNVDDDGIISLNFECSNITADSKSKAIFNTPSEEDLGIYSCFVTHTDGASASYTLSEEELKKLLEISHDHKFPKLAVELLEKGRVRFWLQAEKISANAKIEYVFNDNMVSQGEKYKMNFDKNTGIIEMFMDSLSTDDEGTFTFQLQDGKAKNQSSLVLIGDVFKELQKESEFQRKEWHRKQGPHFVEYLGYEVTPECHVRVRCKVGNMKKDSVALWYKDGREVKVDEKLDFSEGVLALEITQISKKDAGVIQRPDEPTNSSTPLKIQSTEEGIRLYTFVNYYNDELHVTWHHKDAAIAFTERIKSGVVGEQLWLQITEPTEKDKGKYAIEFFDGKGGLQRTVELAGQAFDDAFAEFQRLKAAAIAERNRARVAGGLPDVVTIQEGKALNLTCNIWGDPVPEVTWLKNEREMVSDDHYILKFESGKFASFTITSVNTSDSGKYSILVKNKYGTESGDFTLNVIESMPDFGVVSYLADADGNISVGPTTPPSKSLPKTPPLTLTNATPENKPKEIKLNSSTPASKSSSKTTIPKPSTNTPKYPSSPNLKSQTPDPPLLSPPVFQSSSFSHDFPPDISTPTQAEDSIRDEKVASMLEDALEAMHLTEPGSTSPSEAETCAPAMENLN